MAQIQVVVVGGSANALGVLRSLPHCALTLLCDSQSAPAWHSRFGKKVQVADTKAPGIVQDLLSLAPTFQGVKPVLMLTEEKTVLHVSAARDALAPFYQFLFCPHPQLVALQSKEGFAEAAQQAGSPVPRGVVLRCSADLAAIDALQYPCVFKPLEQNEAYSRQFKKAYKVQSAAEVATLYQQIEPVLSEMIVQEWLEGPDSAIYFCLAFYDHNSKLVQSFTGRKLRSWPLQVGGTAACTSAPEAAAELEALTSQFVRAIGYTGLIGMEFKFDANRGGYYMIEPTVGRTDYQHEIATLSGTNLMAAIVAFFAGEPTPPVHAKHNVVWFDEIADANALAHGAPADLCADYVQVAAVRRWNDPKPGVKALLNRITRRLKRR
jgi:predicted ATP-grasp superfamily ATP-dependent carboligase